jgi:hypothetical protein
MPFWKRAQCEQETLRLLIGNTKTFSNLNKLNYWLTSSDNSLISENLNWYLDILFYFVENLYYNNDSLQAHCMIMVNVDR